MSGSNLHERINEPRNDREEAAFAYADRGWNVLPLNPRAKTPFKGNGVTHATRDKAQIRAWFSDNLDINIGIAAGNGLVVLDADSTEAAEALSSFPPTLTASTGKGKHFYYAATRPYENSVSAVFNKVDVRSFGGYVVAPPSVHANGATYQWENPDVSIASLPPEIERRLEPDNNAPTIVDADTSETIIREGRRNDWLTKTAGSLVRHCVGAGFSETDAKTLLQAKNLEHCRPPLDRSEVDAIAKSIYAIELARPKNEFRILSRADIDLLPLPEFLIEGFLVKNSLAILYDAPTTGKSYIALAFAISVATGSAWFGRRTSPAPVLYVCAEGAASLRPRINASELHNQLSADLLSGLGEAVQLHSPKEVDAFISSLRRLELRPGLIVFDTLSRCTVGVDENAAKEMGLAIAGIERIKRAFDATILLVHHSTKADGKTIRGSSVLLGAVDTALAMVINKKGERILSVEKQKDGKQAESLSFTLQSISESDEPVLALASNTKSASLTPNDNKALNALAALGIAPYTEWFEASGLTKATFNRSRTRLSKAKLINKSEDGLYGLTAPCGRRRSRDGYHFGYRKSPVRIDERDLAPSSPYGLARWRDGHRAD